jgi:hypothetical protein
MIRIAFKIIIIQFISLPSAFTINNLKILKAKYKTYPGQFVPYVDNQNY